jgi:AcrR family transcriptional regulator
MVRLTSEARQNLAAARRSQILAAALGLMAKSGFAATSIEDIARAAQLGKGTVYLYFPTKEALLEELFKNQSLLPEVLPLIEELRPDSTLEDIVYAAVPKLWRALKNRREVIMLLLREGTREAEYGMAFMRSMLPYNEMIAQLLAQRIGPERAAAVDPFVAIRALVSMLLGMFIEQEILGGGAVRSIEEQVLTRSVAELFLNGVRGPAGKGT